MMNQQERDDLREKHRRDGVLGCWTCQDYFWNDEYPCDVIKVLDAWEEVTFTGRTDGLVSPAQTDTCTPECGEKL